MHPPVIYKQTGGSAMKKTALITGASRGIGAETARLLARDGWKVIISYLNSEKEALALSAEIGAAAVRADVADKEQVRRMFHESGGVDLLVNNAGIALEQMFGDTSVEDWQRLFAVNVDGVFHCCQAALPHMIRQKSGRIINVSSIWGITGASCEVAYSATKAAVIGLTKALAKELGPSGICVNCVAPGVIGTDMNASLPESAMEMLKEETPLGRIGTARDVAETICFLASDAAAFITGQIISPNGGIVI